MSPRLRVAVVHIPPAVRGGIGCSDNISSHSIGTTDIKNILKHVEQEMGLRDQNRARQLPNCEGSMTYIGPKVDVDLDWTVRLDGEYAASIPCPYHDDRDQIIVRA